MRICVVGTGAIGGFLGANLSVSGQDVSFIDKGEQLEAFQKNGLRLITQEGREHHITKACFTNVYEEAGPQDYVILAVKAHQIREVAEHLPALFHTDTSIVTVQNGIPWWYFKKHGGEFDGLRLESLDPLGVIEKNIESDRIIGCIAYPAAAVVEPGVIRQVNGNRFSLGELDDSGSRRCLDLQKALIEADFKSYILDDLRSEIWLKAWGTLSFNPISALTHATLVDICRFPETRALAAKMMREAEEIAGKIGITFRHTIERRIAGAEGVGIHKTSMLQDVESGRTLELEALVGAILEIARMTGTSSPAIETVYACTKLLNKTFTEANSRITLLPLS
ncbi:MAG: 2-dehydropantoate 2-reductase [Candidatus Aminicenantes bacterium]|nr:2-dehydropantoate 2-reductase [Candidatus Aminicenantes bacterium]